MSKTYQIKTNASQGGSQIIDLTPATGKAPVKVPAASGARYELIDPATKAAPDNIRVMRKGKDLHIFFDGNTEAGATIENFYVAHTDEQPSLVGSTEAGKLFEYIPESAAPSSVVSQLGETGNAYGMALGGVELAATSGAAVGLLAPVVGAAGFGPLLGAGALGAAALAGGGGGGSTPAPPVATAKLADASDSGTKGDNKTNINTPTILGTAPAGSTTKVNVKGTDYDAKVNADGTLSYNITEHLKDGTYTPVIKVTQNGTTTSYDGTPFTIDTQTTVAITDSGLAGTTKSISGTAEAGDTVVVTDVNNKTIGTTTADSSGKWSLTPTSAVAAGTITASATDVVGNTKDAAGNPAVDTGSNLINGGKALVLTIATDANNDLVINSAEKGNDSDAVVTAAFDNTKVSVGDVVTFKDTSGNVKTATLTTADMTAGLNGTGLVSIKWTLPDNGAVLNISATLADAHNTAGNTTPTANDKATVDTLALNTDIGLGLSIFTDSNHDHMVNIAELNGATSLTSKATFNNNAIAGDKIVFTATNDGVALTSQTVTLAAQDITNGYVSVTFANPEDGKTQTVTANYVDKFGNTATDTTPTDYATLDATAPSNQGVGLKVKISPDSNSDQKVNSAELNTSVDKDTPNFTSHISVTNGVAGDTIIVNATNTNGTGTTSLPSIYHLLSSDDIKNNGFDVYFKKPDQGQTQNVTAYYVDKAGNPAADTVGAQATLDTLAPTNLGLTIDLDNGVDKTTPQYANDHYINAKEKGSATTTSLTATFRSDDVKVGDIITFSNGIKNYDHAVTLTDADVKNGYVISNGYDSKGWGLPLEGGTLNVTASFKDAAGNTATAANAATVDTSVASFKGYAGSSGKNGAIADDVTFALLNSIHEDATFNLQIGQIGTTVKFTGEIKKDGTVLINQSTFIDGKKLLSGSTTKVLASDAPEQQISLDLLDTAGNGSHNLVNFYGNAYTIDSTTSFHFIV